MSVDFLCLQSIWTDKVGMQFVENLLFCFSVIMGGFSKVR